MFGVSGYSACKMCARILRNDWGHQRLFFHKSLSALRNRTHAFRPVSFSLLNHDALARQFLWIDVGLLYSPGSPTGAIPRSLLTSCIGLCTRPHLYAHLNSHVYVFSILFFGVGWGSASLLLVCWMCCTAALIRDQFPLKLFSQCYVARAAP